MYPRINNSNINIIHKAPLKLLLISENSSLRMGKYLSISKNITFARTEFLLIFVAVLYKMGYKGESASANDNTITIKI